VKRLLAPALAVALAFPALARADEGSGAQVVLVSADCGQFWSYPGGDDSPAAWDAVISLASCIQDRRVRVVAGADDLGALVAELREALAPSLELYATAIADGPAPVKLRAAYHVGLAQVAMMTRARTSLASSDLRTSLEPLLEPHAELAYYIFTTIHRAAADDPSLARDVVTQYMVRSAGQLAGALRHRWRTPPGDDVPRLARTR
jgi:hypothetical protein